MRSTASFITVLLIYLAIETYLYFGVKSLLNNKKKKTNKIYKWIYLVITGASVISLIAMIALRGSSAAFWMKMAVGVFMINLIAKLVLLLFIFLDDIRRLEVQTRRKVVALSSKPLTTVYWTITVLAIISLFLIVNYKDVLSDVWFLIFFWVFIFNFISKLVFLLVFVVLNRVRLNVIRKEKIDESGKRVSRSSFLQKAGLITAGIPIAALTTGIVIGGAYKYKVHKKTLGFKNIPKAFHGLKIVQLSDIHVGSFYDKAAVQKGIDMVMAQKPDLVFFTGDLVNDQAKEMDDYYDVFSQVKAPMGVYSILGNHDYGDYHQWESTEAKIANFEGVKAIHAKLGWQLLLNEHIYLEKDNEKVAVIGVENWGSGFHKMGDLSKAYQNCEADFKILLSHDPTHWDEEVTKDYLDIDLTLSGHTHGAQMGIETHNFKWSPIQFRYSKWAGLYQKDKQHLYINRGFGFLGYPGRIGIWPEITVLELEHTA